MIKGFFNEPLCKCGCGGKVGWSKQYKKWNKYINHHGTRGKSKYNKKKEKSPSLCKCGCGKKISWNKYQRRWNKYICGHNNRDKTFGISELNQKSIKSFLYYNPETGIFYWNKDFLKQKKDTIAGCLDDNGYIIIGLNNKLYKAHRLAWLYMEGYFPENEIDHINRIKDDNRWSNLRHVSKQCNARNSGKQKNNTSGITGVCWVKLSKKWRSYIKINSKNDYLGDFNNKIDAVKARWEAEKKYNFPNCNTTSTAYLYLKKDKT